MTFVDTHCHLYLDDFKQDRAVVIETAIEQGVKFILMPDIDSSSSEKLMQLHYDYPSVLFPALALHPTSVKEDYKNELNLIEQKIKNNKYYAIGETGIDLYWSDTFKKQQIESFHFHINLAITNNLPIIIHSRSSLQLIIDIINDYRNSDLKAVFHCFPGNTDQAKVITEMNYYIGVGGVLTYKKSLIRDVVKLIPLEYLLLETDAPYLTPAGFGKKRNEPSSIPLIAKTIAEIKAVTIDEVAEFTTINAFSLFNFNSVNKQHIKH